MKTKTVFKSRDELQSRIRGSHAKAAVDCAKGYVVLWQRFTLCDG